MKRINALRAVKPLRGRIKKEKIVFIVFKILIGYLFNYYLLICSLFIVLCSLGERRSPLHAMIAGRFVYQQIPRLRCAPLGMTALFERVGGWAAASPPPSPFSPHYCLVIPTGVSEANGMEESADIRSCPICRLSHCLFV
jgi:hypothetical protein